MPEERSVKVRLTGDISDFNKKMLEASAGAKAFTRDLDSSTDRMSNLTQSALALGPALVPITAAAIPAISGLTNQLAFAGAAAGVAVLAFQGVGTALKAVNDYGIDPTTANFQKMNEALATLGPQGQEFVMFLQKIRPELDGLQNVAQAGLFPGLESGIKSMLDLLPQAEKIVGTVATAIGDLIAEAGDNLNDPRWVKFFDFIQNEARPTLIDMGRTVGNFAESFANLWMAFAPLSANFSHSFLDLSRDFSQWTAGLDKTEGFQEFVDYINRVGPKAWDTLGALGNALLQIVEAAAPIGEATLPAITALANVIGKLADSSLGPVVIGVVSLTSALSRLKAISMAGNSSAIGGLFSNAFPTGNIKAGVKQLSTLTAAQDGAARSASNLGRSLVFASGDAKVRSGFAQFGKYAAGAAGLGIVVSGLDKKLGLTNTASLALAGSLVGPWGAAIGGGVGLAMDFAAATDTVGDSFKRLDESLKLGSAGYKQQVADLAKSKKAVEDLKESVKHSGDLGASFSDGLKGVKNDITGFFGTSDVDKATESYKRHAAAVKQSGVEDDQARAAELGLSVDLKGTTNSLRDQTLAVLDNIAAHNARNNENLTASGKEIAYQAAIDATTDALKKNGATLDINTPKGRANQSALDAQVAAWNNLAPASQLATGAQEKARAQIVAAARAFGDSAKEANAYADSVMNIPPDVVTAVKLLGADASAAQIAKVIDGYNLTPKQIKTALEATDLTKPKIKAVNKALDALDAKRAHPTIGVDDEATSKINRIQRLINGMNGKTVHVAVEGGLGGGITSHADGGYIRGPGGPREDAIPAWLSNGEYVVNAAATSRNLPLLHAINSQKYADGGLAGTSMLAGLPAAGISALAKAMDKLVGAVLGQTAAQNRFNKFSDLQNGAASKVDQVHQYQQIRDLNSQLGEKIKKGKHKGEYTLKGLDRDAAKLELADAKSQLATMLATNKALKSYGDLKAEQRRLDASNASAAFAGNAGIGSLTSIAAVDRSLTKTIQNLASFTTVMGQLKAKGASPWLIDQLQQAGPTTGAIKLAKQYLSSPDALARINAESSLLTSVSNSYGALVTDPKFMAAGSYNGLSAATTKSLIQVQTMTDDKLATEVARQVAFALGAQATGAGV